MRKEAFVAHRIVIKIGSKTITDGGQPLNEHFMDDIARQASELFRNGVQVAIVTSGAIASGRRIMDSDNNDIVDKQVVASFGQCHLIEEWSKAFRKYSVPVAQFLISEADLENPRWPLLGAMQRGIPIINANDTVNPQEVEQLAISADNDRLAGYVAHLIDADALLLLTDTDGVLDGSGKIINSIGADESIKGRVVFHGKSERGTGGMRSKVEVAQGFARGGKTAVIANGRAPDVILKVAMGRKLGTKIAVKKR